MTTWQRVSFRMGRYSTRIDRKRSWGLNFPQPDFWPGITSDLLVIQEQSPEVPVIGCHAGHFYVDTTIRSLRVPLLAMMYSYYDSAVGR